MTVSTTVLYEKFENQYNKMVNVCDENDLTFSLKKDSYPISMIIKPDFEKAAQQKFEFEGTEDKKGSDPEAEIKFVFADNLVIRTSKDIVISETLFNKLKNIAKKMHSFYMQDFFARKMEMEELKKLG